MTLHIHYSDNINIYEIGVDEAGRGPLFGRVYAAAVILPKTIGEEMINPRIAFLESVKKIKVINARK